MFKHTMSTLEEKLGVTGEVNSHLTFMGEQGWELVSACTGAAICGAARIYLFWKMPLADYQELLDREKSES